MSPSSVNESLHLRARQRRKKAAEMADYSSVAPPSSNAGGGMNDAFKDALQRARQVKRIHTQSRFCELIDTPSCKEEGEFSVICR